MMFNSIAGSFGILLIVPFLAPPLLAADLVLEDFRDPKGNWMLVGDVQLSEDSPTQFSFDPGKGILTNGATGKTSNLLTKAEFGDVDVELEVFVPKDGNSGIYLQGRYEVQIRDSHGVTNPTYADIGGIYQRWDESRNPKGFDGSAPRRNVARPPGVWQTLRILFQAPRFDDEGEKVADAAIKKVVLNGHVVQEDVTVSGPTRSATFDDETARGPLMLQGDHGPVAFRNLRIRKIKSH